MKKGFYAVFNKQWDRKTYIIYLWDGKCVWCVDSCREYGWRVFKWRRTIWKSMEKIKKYCKNGEVHYLGK